MGLTALLLALATQSRSAGNASMAVLFGSLFSVNPDIIPYVAAFAALCILALAVIWRPALLSTASPALARARGVRTGAVDAAFMIVLGIGVALGAVSVGAVLSTALLIGPAACGLRLFSRVRGALITACGLGVACVWGGIILSYESYTWLNGVSLSVSFCIVALILACYLVSRGLNRLCAMKRRKRVTHV
jgi:zinc/manganese transport system permease protein